ncbi:hypothetical protein HHX47_DHR2001130 [Lentinula edodes]|nr:hypothetical protein HHX47_DHR2001130 [Lentinula edodes]
MDINSGMSDSGFENQVPASPGDSSEFSFEALGIHDQWAYVKQLYGAAWEVTPDLGEHEENTEFPMEDGRAADQDSEGEEDDYGDIGHIDWEEFRGYGRGGRLTAAEQAGAEFFREFTSIKEMLGKYDLAIWKAFAYKVQTHTTDRAFKKTHYAFPSDPPLPKLDEMRSRVAALSSVEPEVYHCCVNSCICYVGSHELRQKCPFCNESQYHPDGKPRKIFIYIPIIPRLQAFLMNQKIAQQMQYRHEYCNNSDISSSRNINDVFDGDEYLKLQNEFVEVGNRKLSHRYFDDHRDIALGLSMDGFGPFKRCKHTCWPLILFNYNLPPDICFHLEHILALGVIPGPKKPKDMDSFLWPFVREMLRLALGISSYDVCSKKMFSL